MRVSLAVALSLLTTLTACSRVGCKREVPPPPPPRDEVFTALEHFREPIAGAKSDESRRSLAQLIAEVSATQDASFAATGDVYVHHVSPAPDYGCIAARTCFSDYLRFLADEERRTFPPGDVSQKAAGLAANFSLTALEADVAQRVAYVESELPRVDAISFRGDPKSDKVVLLLSTGHPIEVRREAAIARLLASHSVRVGELRRERAPALFDALGRRLTAVAMVNGQLRKDVIEYEQWLELLFPGEAFPASVHRFTDLTIFDAHEHVREGGAGRLLDIARAEHLTGAIVAALPTPKDFTAPNEVVFAAARTEAPFLRPFVTLDEQAPDALATMRALLGRGARGLKLLTGHDDFHRARGAPSLAPEPLRAVFTELEERHIPVLWHVNTHLFVDGFLAALKAHPRLVVVIPHFAGYLTYAPQIVRRLLEENPNLYVDLSVGTQPRYLRRSFEDVSALRDEWRRLFIELPDRFLLGFDMVVTESTSRAHARMLVDLYRGLLEEDEFDLDYFPARGFSLLPEESHHHPRMKGLALPREVLSKIYSGNAARLYGQL